MKREVCAIDALKALAAKVPESGQNQEQRPATSTSGSERRLMVATYLQAAGVGFRNPVTSGSWTKYVLNECPFDGNHKAPDSYVSQHDDGAITFHCSHDSCGGNKWQQFKGVIGKPKADHYDPPLSPAVDDYPLKPEGNGAIVDKTRSVVVKAQDYTPFPVENLPDVLRIFCTEVSAAVGCDLAFVALPVLAVCAAAIGRSRQLRIKSGWFVPSLLWTLIVGESGTQKSPPVRMATKPFKDLQSEQAESYQRELAAYLDESAAYKTALKRWNQTQEGDKPVEPVQPSRPRCLVQDSTIEALAPILKDNERGVLMARDELAGWLASFDRYASGKGKSSGDVPKWLEIYNCEPMVIDRKTGDSPFLYVKGPSASICGGIQPDILASCMTDEHKSSGLESRILMAYPPRRPKQWHDEELSDQTMKAYSDTITELFSLGMTSDVSGNLIPATLKLSTGALNLFKAFVNSNGAEQQALHGHLASQWSKLEEIPARLAIVLHCVHQVTTGVDDAFVVGERTMQEAIQLTEWFKSEVLRIKSALSESEDIREARHLIEWIRSKGGRITARDLCRNRRDIESTEQADLQLIHLVSIGAGNWEGIHKSREFILND
jgi:hypothetical protein